MNSTNKLPTAAQKETEQNTERKIQGGLYLVLDPRMGKEYILPRLEAALEGGVDVVQLWNYWSTVDDQADLIVEVCRRVHRYGKPVLINENWELLKTTPLDGVHFDTIPVNWDHIVQSLKGPFISGLTCTNNPEQIQWAIDRQLSYISFCSMFPSDSVAKCDIVDPTIIRATRTRTPMLMFGSGGVTPAHVPTLMALGLNGVAVISAIMKADDPRAAAVAFKKSLSIKI